MSIFKRFMKNIYAGPDVSIKTVYAGPEQMKKMKKNKDSEINGVYAGPEQMKNMKKNKDVELNEVYAGPEMMGWNGEKDDTEEELPTYPAQYEKADTSDRRESRNMKLVYAPPSYFDNKNSGEDD